MATWPPGRSTRATSRAAVCRPASSGKLCRHSLLTTTSTEASARSSARASHVLTSTRPLTPSSSALRRSRPGPFPSVLTRFGWHRPLLWLTLGMVTLAVIALVGLGVDLRTITGMPLWAKPLKFSLSVLIYSVTLSWLLGQLPRAH